MPPRAAVNAAFILLLRNRPQQIIRNMRSIGLNLEPWVKKGLLRFQCLAPHAVWFGNPPRRHAQAGRRNSNRDVVVIDPISNLVNTGSPTEVRSMLLRLVDFLKSQQITAFFTSLSSPDMKTLEQTDVGISSIMDTLAVAARH